MLLTVTKAFFYAVHEGILGARDYEVDLKKYKDKGDMRQREVYLVLDCILD
jgi:hypothetical protein